MNIIKSFGRIVHAIYYFGNFPCNTLCITWKISIVMYYMENYLYLCCCPAIYIFILVCCMLIFMLNVDRVLISWSPSFHIVTSSSVVPDVLCCSALALEFPNSLYIRMDCFWKEEFLLNPRICQLGIAQNWLVLMTCSISYICCTG